MKEIVIVGGGTAGWLTALYAKHIFPGRNITLIESDSIGILGAGEGTTPTFVGFLNSIGIDVYDLIAKTKGSIKNGISFENWNGDGKKYFHEFYTSTNLNHFSFRPLFTSVCYHYYIKNIISQKKDLDKYLYPSRISYKNKVDPRNILFAVHFDAVILAEYLKNIGIERGIKRIEGIAEDIVLDNKGNIKTILTKDRKIKADFVFDCTGFKRLIIGKLFKTKWISYEKWLPMNSAIAFPMKQDKKIKPYTQAIAADNGWIWRIPLQHRYGAGYIFDKNYTNEDKALQEAEKMFGKLEVVNRFSFSAGRYDKTWVNNCIAIGLSSGFTEPLEATSIWLSVTHLEMLRHYLSAVDEDNQNLKDNYNKFASQNNDTIKDFIFLHYLTKREDTKFWKDFKKERYPLYKENTFLNDFIHNKLTVHDHSLINGPLGFGIESFHQVAHGLGLLDLKKETWYKYQNPTTEQYFMRMQQAEKQSAMDHKKLLMRLNRGVRF
jgi:tryptophan halogenase